MLIQALEKLILLSILNPRLYCKNFNIMGHTKFLKDPKYFCMQNISWACISINSYILNCAN